MEIKIEQKELRRVLWQIATVAAPTERRVDWAWAPYVLIDASLADAPQLVYGSPAIGRVEFGIDCEVEQPGEVTALWRLLNSVVASWPGLLTIKDKKPSTVRVTGGPGQALELSALAVKEFPVRKMPSTHADLEFRLSADDLKLAMRRVAGTRAHDESRPILTAINAVVSEGAVKWATADGYRLSVSSLPPAIVDAHKNGLTLPHTLNLPGDAAEWIGKHVKVGKDVRIAIYGSMFAAHTDEWSGYWPLTQGSFPRYEKLIPASHRAVVEFDVKELTQALHAVGAVARGGAYVVRLESFGEPDRNEIVLSAHAEEIGAIEQLVSFEPVEGVADWHVAIHADYLMHALAASGAERVHFGVQEPENPITIRPSLPESDYLTVIMPIFVQWDMSSKKVRLLEPVHV